MKVFVQLEILTVNIFSLKVRMKLFYEAQLNLNNVVCKFESSVMGTLRFVMILLKLKI